MKVYFDAQVSKTRLKMEDVEEECVCIHEHTKTKTVSQGKKTESLKVCLGETIGSMSTTDKCNCKQLC